MNNIIVLVMAHLILLTSFNSDITYQRHLGAYHLATWVRCNGYTVKVIDYCHAIPTNTLVDIIEKHIDNDTLAIGVSSTFWNIMPVTNIFRLLPDKSEPSWVLNVHDVIATRYSIPWLLGGWGVHSNMITQNWWIKFYGTDVENQLIKWMDEKTSNSMIRSQFDFQHHGGVEFTEKDYIQPHEVLPIEMARGCRFNCKFCRYELRGKNSDDYIIDKEVFRQELITNYEHFGVTRYSIVDATVNESERKIEMLADVAQSLPFTFEWIGCTRLDMINRKPHTIQLLKDSGLRSTFFGIESFNLTAATAVGKAWNSRHGKRFLLELKNKWQQDISFQLSLIIGLPGEDKASIESTYDWCLTNDIDQWNFYVLKITSQTDRYSLSIFDKQYSKFGYTFPDKTQPSNWVNEYWNASEAEDFACTLNSSNADRRRITNFSLAQIASNGYTFEYLHQLGMANLDWPEQRSRFMDFVQRYIKVQLSD